MFGFQKNNFQDIRASNAHHDRDPAIYKIMLADNMPELMCYPVESSDIMSEVDNRIYSRNVKQFNSSERDLKFIKKSFDIVNFHAKTTDS